MPPNPGTLYTKFDNLIGSQGSCIESDTHLWGAGECLRGHEMLLPGSYKEEGKKAIAEAI